MRPIRVFILDDEPLAVGRLRTVLAALPDVHVIGASTKASAALAKIRTLKPEAIFLDINMPGLSGFDVVEQSRGGDQPLIVFVTAHRDFAADAFGVNAVDYLLKPFGSARVEVAVGKLRDALMARDALAAGAQEVPAGPAAAPQESFWALGHRERVRIVANDIVWVEAEGDYVRFHTYDGGAGKIVRSTLQEIQSRLDANAFVRVHRSVIARRSSITAVRRKRTGSLSAQLITGESIPVGRRFLKGLRQIAGDLF